MTEKNNNQFFIKFEKKRMTLIKLISGENLFGNRFLKSSGSLQS